MKKTQRTTAVGVFEDRARAQQAVNELRRMGFREDQIGVAGRDTEGITGAHETSGTGSHAAAGAAAGVAAGAGVGALWGLALISGIVLPVVGPAIVGGTLGVILSSAAAGAAAAGLVGALIGMGIPEEEATFYDTEFQAGRTIVTVNADTRYDEAVAILQRNESYDFHTASGRCSKTSTAACATGTKMTGTKTSTQAGKVVQAKEEKLHPHKQTVETGEVTVRKEVHTEQKTLQVPVTREEIVIERHAPATGRTVATSDIKAGEEIRIPVREEQVHLEKETVVKEEVSVGKRKVKDTEQVTGTVRKEEIKVDKKGEVDVKEKRR